MLLVVFLGCSLQARISIQLLGAGFVLTGSRHGFPAARHPSRGRKLVRQVSMEPIARERGSFGQRFLALDHLMGVFYHRELAAHSVWNGS